MQTQAASAKRLGHVRRPSYGKVTPISTLLLNLSGSASIRHDGVSPDLSQPSHVFSFGTDGAVSQHDHDRSESDSMAEATTSFIEQEKSAEQSDAAAAGPKMTEIDLERTFLKCVNYHHTQAANEATSEETSAARDADDIDKYLPNGRGKPCLICSAKSQPVNSEELASAVSQPMKDLCDTLCDAKCQTVTAEASPPITPTAHKMVSRSNSSRHEFLASMLLDGTSVVATAPVADGGEATEQPADAVADGPKDLSETYFRDKLKVAEALANTSAMTSPAAKRRLAARRMEMNLNSANFVYDSENSDYIPPKELLMYLVRMGSFNSAPKINNTDTQDDALEVPHGLANAVDLVNHCKLMRGENRPELLQRSFFKPIGDTTSADITDGMRYMQLNSVSKVCSPPKSSPNKLRILQWNILSQSLGQHNDNFVCCPDDALTWESRKYLIVQEIIQNDPDVICLQEVDHFKFLQSILSTLNYDGIFYPKPDSPCLYITENNGPDGCAIFYKKSKFELINYDTRILEVWRIQSNQVTIAANLRVVETGKEVCVCTTHLKARHGTLLAKLRNEQGKDLLKFIQQASKGRPLLISGDFNAEPTEPVYTTIINCDALSLSSAYADMLASLAESEDKSDTNDSDSLDGKSGEAGTEKSRVEYLIGNEPPFTTWKIREDGEVCHTIDYVFYSQDKFKVDNCLMFPHGNEIGKDRTPSHRYPSDHFSLMCDFELKDDEYDEDQVNNGH